MTFLFVPWHKLMKYLQLLVLQHFMIIMYYVGILRTCATYHCNNYISCLSGTSQVCYTTWKFNNIDCLLLTLTVQCLYVFIHSVEIVRRFIAVFIHVMEVIAARNHVNSLTLVASYLRHLTHTLFPVTFTACPGIISALP